MICTVCTVTVSSESIVVVSRQRIFWFSMARDSEVFCAYPCTPTHLRPPFLTKKRKFRRPNPTITTDRSRRFASDREEGEVRPPWLLSQPSLLSLPFPSTAHSKHSHRALRYNDATCTYRNTIINPPISPRLRE